MAEPFDRILPELEGRAGLLCRLGYTKEAASARLQANLSWDFPDGQSSVTATQVDAIVERVFGSGATGETASHPKAGAR